MSCLNLVVPGLLGPFASYLTQNIVLPRHRMIEKLLARSDRLALQGVGLEPVLFSLFGCVVDAGQDTPSAAVCRFADLGERDSAWWLHADPVSLKPDRDRLLLFDSEQLRIDPLEAQSLAVLFNDYFRDRGWELQVAHPQRWYLKLPHDPELRTTSISDVVGRSIDNFLPHGPAARNWRVRMNEIQMLFYGAGINRRREERGMPLINSLWFWGGGRIPASLNARYSLVYARNLLARGLCGLTDIPQKPIPASARELQLGGAEADILIVYSDLQRSVLDADLSSWLAAMDRFEADWTAPLLQAVSLGRIRCLRILPCDGNCFEFKRPHQLRFWRPAVSLLN